MGQWLSMSPYARPLLGLVAIVCAFFLIKFIIRQVFNMLKFVLVLILVAIGLFFYLDFSGYFGPSKAAAADFNVESEAEQSTPRQIYAQIVDADEKDKFVERAILDGRPFKFLLKRVAKLNTQQILKEVNDRTTFENLTDEPDLHRGEAYATQRGVILEVSNADLTPEYGLPGYTVLPAIFVNTAHEVFALRILCAPGSKVYEKLKAGIAEDKLPVVNLAGLFFKNYARQPADLKESPWIKPLLVCPEPDFVKGEEPREVMRELRDTGNARLLPSQRVEGPPAEERLVLNVALENDGTKLRAWGEAGGAGAGSDTNAFVAKAVEKLKSRLPAQQIPAAVVVLKSGKPEDPRVTKVLDALKAAGVTRVCVKQEAVQPIAVTPGK